VAVSTEQALPTWTDGTFARRIVSVDHKSVGVLYLLTAAFFLLGLGIARLLDFIDLAHAPGGLLDDFATYQLLSLQGTSAVFLVGLPATLGLAAYLVPLQIGARGMVHPRLNATGYWLYLCGAALLLVSFASGDASSDSVAAPLSPTGRQLWLLGLVLASAGPVSTSISLLETILTRRASGMIFSRLPVFTLTAGAYAIVLVAGMTIVGVAAAVFLIDDGSARGFFTYDASEGTAFYQTYAWFLGHPLTYALFLPIVGLVSEAVPVRGRWAPGARALVLASIAAVAALGLLLALYHLLADPLGQTLANGIPYAGFILVGALVPTAIAWVLQLGPFRRPPEPVWLLTVTMLTLLVISTVLGFALGFPGDYDADSGSSHLAAEFEGTLGGTAILGLAVGILYFFPKLSGRLYDERAARRAVALLATGMILTMLGQHIAGEGDLASFSSAAKTGSALALTGYVLVFLGGAAFLVGAVTSWRRGTRVGNDPWRADTLEWYTESPPPPGNFDRLPPIESERPLHDLRERLARGRRA
jgi:heme/copper-type cytochrome/quinol oxidase subunit 1